MSQPAPGFGPSPFGLNGSLTTAILDQLPIGACVSDPADGTILLANQALARILDLAGPPEGCLHEVRCFHADGPPYQPGEMPLQRLLTGGAPADGEEIEVLRRDGTWTTVSVSTSTVLGPAGRPVALVATVSELGDRRRGARYLAAEREVDRALAVSDTLDEAAAPVLRALGSHLGWALAVLYLRDPDAGWLRVRHLWQDGAQFPEAFRQELDRTPVRPGEGFSGRVWQDERPLWLRSAEIAPAEVQRRAMGAALHQAVGIPIRARGEVVGVLTLAALHDRPPDPELMRLAESAATGLGHLAARQRAEEELHLAHERLTALVDSAPVAIFMLDDQLRVTRSNPAAETLYGWGPGEAVGLSVPFGPVIPSEDVAETVAVLRRVLDAGETVQARTVRRRRMDGAPIDVSMTLAPVRGPGGPVEGLISIEADVTERVRFLRIAAHELRNPMASVKAMLQLAQRRIEVGREAGASAVIGVAVEEVDRLSARLDEVLAGFRAGMGELAFKPAPVDLAQVVGAAARPFVIGDQGHRYAVEAPGDAPIWVGEGDARRLEDLLRNLLSNARKYAPDGTDVHVELRRVEGEAVVSVRDHGIGVLDEDKASIFGAFHRGGNLDGCDPGGLGLGLYLGAHIVRRHGGRIWVEDTPGGGATFRFAIPAHAGERAVGDR